MFLRIVIPALILLLAATSAHPVGLPVENPSGDNAMAPGLTRLPDGSGAVLSWIEKQGDQYAFRFSRFADGVFAAPREIARGTDWFANWADTPAVHVRDDGSWLAHWLKKSARSTYAYDIRLAHSRDGGQSWSPARTPHADGTPTEHGFVSYFPTGNRRTGMVWLDGRETLSSADARDHAGFMTLRTAMIGVDGSPGPEILIDDRVCDCCQTASGLTALGPIVAYRDRTDDEIRDIAVVRRTAAGWTEPRILHADGWKIGGCPVNGPSLIAEGMKVVVAWFTMAGDEPRVRFAISKDAGASFAPPVTRSPGTALGRVQLAWLDGGFALGWIDDGEDGARLRISRYSLDGTLLDDLTLTRMDRGRVSGFPKLAAIDGNLLVAWTVSAADQGTRVMTTLVELNPTEN